MGLGTVSEESRRHVPRPPQKSTTFMVPLLASTRSSGAPRTIRCLTRNLSAHSNLRSQRRKKPVGGLFAADEAFVGPHVAPVAVAAAIGDSEVIKIGVD